MKNWKAVARVSQSLEKVTLPYPDVFVKFKFIMEKENLAKASLIQGPTCDCTVKICFMSVVRLN